MPVRRYALHQLKSILQLMGCKTWHIRPIAEQIFQKASEQNDTSSNCRSSRKFGSKPETSADQGCHRTIKRSLFLDIVRRSLGDYDYVKADILRDYEVARQIKDQERSMCILLGGTSGCGKSTLASILASRFVHVSSSVYFADVANWDRMGIATVLSTDHIRHLLRNFVPKEAHSLLFCSSYHAGEVLPDSETSSYDGKVWKGC